MCTRITAALAAVPLALVLALSGCGSDGSDDSDDQVASVSDETQRTDTDSGEPLSQDEIDEAALEFAECMRKNGIDMDDPKPGQGVRIQVQGDDREEMDRAMAACDHIMPKPPPEDEEEMREDMLEMAQCMRDNGVEEFPDPKPGEGINIGPMVGEDPDFESAQEKCSPGMARSGTASAS